MKFLPSPKTIAPSLFSHMMSDHLTRRRNHALAVVLFFLYATTLYGQSAVRLSPVLHDFGVVYLGTRVGYYLTIHNDGAQPLRVKRIVPSCGCTAVGEREIILAPGKKDSVEIRFDTFGFSGKVKKSVVIYTDAKEGYHTAEFKAVVDTDLDYLGGGMSVWLGPLPKGQTKTAAAELINRAPYPIIIERVMSVVPALNCAIMPVPKTIAPGERVTFRFEATGTGEEFFAEYLYLETNNPRQPRVPLRVTFISGF